MDFSNAFIPGILFIYLFIWLMTWRIFTWGGSEEEAFTCFTNLNCSTDFGVGGALNISHAHSIICEASSDVAEQPEPSAAGKRVIVVALKS